MDPDGLDELVADREHGVEGGHGVLVDHGDRVAPKCIQFSLGQRTDVCAGDSDESIVDSHG